MTLFFYWATLRVTDNCWCFFSFLNFAREHILLYLNLSPEICVNGKFFMPLWSALFLEKKPFDLLLAYFASFTTRKGNLWSGYITMQRCLIINYGCSQPVLDKLGVCLPLTPFWHPQTLASLFRLLFRLPCQGNWCYTSHRPRNEL